MPWLRILYSATEASLRFASQYESSLRQHYDRLLWPDHTESSLPSFCSTQREGLAAHGNRGQQYTSTFRTLQEKFLKYFPSLPVPNCIKPKLIPHQASWIKVYFHESFTTVTSLCFKRIGWKLKRERRFLLFIAISTFQIPWNLWGQSSCKHVFLFPKHLWRLSFEG